MRRWPGLAVGGAGVLVLLLVLAFRGSPEPARRSDARTEDGPTTEGRGDAAQPGTGSGAPGDIPSEVDRNDSRIEPIPGTERWHYEEFLRRAAADPDDFDRLAGRKAGSDAPLEERVALLRAAWKVRGKEALRWFADAFASGAAAQDGDADALRGFVVRHLTPHAKSVPEVRDFLWVRVFLDRAVNARERSAAGRAVLQAAGPGEIAGLVAPLPGIPDAAAVEGALVGLGLNSHPAAASALAWLSRSHPDERVRERAAEVSRQRLTGDVGRDDED